MNGWFPRFNRRGDVASGSGSVWVNGQLVADPGWNPEWLDDDVVMFKGAGDLPYQQRVPPVGDPQRLADGASTQYAAGSGRWKGNGYDAYGGRVIAVDVDPANGDLAELVEYNGDNNNHSLFLRGQPIVERQAISDLCLRDGLLVWTKWGVRRETWGFDGSVQPLTVFRDGEGHPVPVRVGSEPWVLVETNTDLRLHPWDSADGYLEATGEDRNLYADARYEVAVDQLQLVFNDSGGTISRASFGLQEPRVNVSDGGVPAGLPDEWPIAARTAPEIFYPFHTCSSRESERALSPDGTGLLADYPQNVIGVADSGAVTLATRVTLPIMLGGLAWAYHPNPVLAAAGRQFGEAVKAAGLQRRVLTQWVAAADDNPVQGSRGAPTAERVAQLEKACWKELFPELPPPPALYYVGPQEVTAGDWFRPPSVGVYMPEFYFTPGTQSAAQIEREMWEKAELYIDKLGWDRPWIPVWQCYRRDWVKPTNMPLIAALQTMFFEGARQIEAELQKRMPAGEQRRVIYGNGLFAILRKEGAIEYPQAMAAHRRMFAAIPAGALPDLSGTGGTGGNGGDGGGSVLAIRLGPYPRQFFRGDPWGLDVPWDIDSDRPIVKRRFQMNDGSVAKVVTHEVTTGADGRWERGVRYKPDRNGPHTFTVTIWDDTGQSASVTSEPVTVTSDPVDGSGGGTGPGTVKEYRDYFVRRWNELGIGERNRAVAAREGFADLDAFERLNPDNPNVATDPTQWDKPRYERIAAECKAFQCPAMIQIAGELHFQQGRKDVGLNVKEGGNRWNDPRLPKSVATDIIAVKPSDEQGNVTPGTEHLTDVMFASGTPFTAPIWDSLGENRDASRPWIAPPQP